MDPDARATRWPGRSLESRGGDQAVARKAYTNPCGAPRNPKSKAKVSPDPGLLPRNSAPGRRAWELHSLLHLAVFPPLFLVQVTLLNMLHLATWYAAVYMATSGGWGAVVPRQLSDGPIVKLPFGTFQGASSGGVESFLGELPKREANIPHC